MIIGDALRGGQNLAIGVKEAKYKKFEIGLLLERLLEKGKIVLKRAYCDWDRFPDYKREFHEAAVEMIEIPGGMIYHSSGSIVVRHTTVDRVVHALTNPGTPPPQEDVLESRVLSRTANGLRVYLKLSRSAIVTVVYDTEHDVVFTRHSPTMATSRSVSTRIAQSDGGDRGFLWRLNSYWRYTQVGGDVRIDLESLSLSRAVPRVARPVARPIIDRIAGESLTRTLESLRDFLNARAQGRPGQAL
jgi:hypothetical protein